MRSASEKTNLMTLIRPNRGWSGLDLYELWEYRDLLYFLVKRDIQVKYRQTVLGVLWVVLQPFLTMVVFSIFFGKLAKLPSEGLPYPIFIYAALLPWQLFSNSILECSNSLVANQHLITKVYFPRLVIPMASVLSAFADFAVAFLILIVMMFFYGVFPNSAICALPIFLLLALLCALGVGLWLSALNVQYRDVRYTVPFLMQLWFFITPVAYPASLVPSSWRFFYGLNPMAGVVEGFRWVLLAKAEVSTTILISSFLITLVLLVSGFRYFKRMERNFADVI